MPAPIAVEFPTALLNSAVSSVFRPVAVNFTSRGLFTGNQIIDGPSYQIWKASVTLPAFKQPEWRELSAFVSHCYDSRTPVLLFDPVRQHPIGSWSHAGTGPETTEPWGDGLPWGDGTFWASSRYVNGCVVDENAPKGRDTILLAQAPALRADVAKPGDVIGINGYLYEVTSGAHSDADGRFRVSIRPRLREAALPGDAVTARRARGAFYIEAGGDFQIVRDSFTHRGSASMSFVEALP